MLSGVSHGAADEGGASGAVSRQSTWAKFGTRVIRCSLGRSPLRYSTFHLIRKILNFAECQMRIGRRIGTTQERLGPFPAEHRREHKVEPAIAARAAQRR